MRERRGPERRMRRSPVVVRRGEERWVESAPIRGLKKIGRMMARKIRPAPWEDHLKVGSTWMGMAWRSLLSADIHHRYIMFAYGF